MAGARRPLDFSCKASQTKKKETCASPLKGAGRQQNKKNDLAEEKEMGGVSHCEPFIGDFDYADQKDEQLLKQRSTSLVVSVLSCEVGDISVGKCCRLSGEKVRTETAENCAKAEAVSLANTTYDLVQRRDYFTRIISSRSL